MLALRCMIRTNIRAGTRAMTAFVNPTPPEYVEHGTKESRAAAAKDMNSNPVYAAYQQRPQEQATTMAPQQKPDDQANAAAANISDKRKRVAGLYEE